MVKKREPRKPTPTEADIEAFAAGADGGSSSRDILEFLKRDEQRGFKQMRVPFNRYEYEILSRLAKQSGRSKLNTIRWALQELYEREHKKEP